MGVNAGVWRAMNTGFRQDTPSGQLAEHKGNDPLPHQSLASTNAPQGLLKYARWRVNDRPSPPAIVMLLWQARGKIPASAPYRKWERR